MSIRSRGRRRRLRLPTGRSRWPAPKAGRVRPLVVVLADNGGTETTDFIMPYGILKDSGAADVVTVSTGPVPFSS